MEDVDAIDPADWSAVTFARAATALGGLAARSRVRHDMVERDRPELAQLRGYVENRVLPMALPMISNEALWQHPLLSSPAHQRLRFDLLDLARSLPMILDHLDALPQAVPHGDAAPQNLLVSRQSPDTFVAIDIAFQCPLAVGFDLGQLLIGQVDGGLTATGGPAGLHEIILPAFLRGLRDHGADIDPEDVRYGYVGGLVVRSGFTSIPFEVLNAAPTTDTAVLLERRIALTRFIADQAQALIHSDVT